MTRTATAPLSCAHCAARINPGDAYDQVDGANYRPGHAPVSTVGAARPWVASTADLAAGRWGGEAA